MLSDFDAIIAKNLFALKGVSAARLFLTSEYGPTQSVFNYSAAFGCDRCHLPLHRNKNNFKYLPYSHNRDAHLGFQQPLK